LLARLLGAEQFGLYTLALSALTIAAGLAGLGMAPALVRYVSVFVKRRDIARLWGTLQVGLGLSMIVSLGVGIGLFALAPLIAVRIFDEPRLVPLLRLGSLMIPFSVLGNMLAAATRGFNKMQYTAFAQNIAQPMIRLIMLIVVALVIGLNALNALAVLILAVAIVFTILLYFLYRLFDLRRPLHTAQRNLRQMLSFSLPVYGTRLIKTFRGNIQTILLGSFQAVATVGVFAVARRVNMVGLMFHQAIATTSAPIVSGLYDQGKKVQLARFYQTMTKWSFTVNLPVFLILQLFPGAILLIFGKEYVGGAIALTILAWGNLIEASTGICGVVIDMTGRTGLKLVNVITVFAVAVGLNLLLIPQWGLVGAAVASTTATLIVNLMRLVEVYILYRLQPYNLEFLKPVAAGLVALASAWVISQLFPSEPSLILVGLNILIILAVYAGMILLLGLSQEDRAILVRLSGRFRVKFNK
jgi:O-antigen/teichoic acid export membrane protein